MGSRWEALCVHLTGVDYLGEEGVTQYFATVFCVGIEKCPKGPCIFDAGAPPLTLEELVMFLPKTSRIICLQICTGHVESSFQPKVSTHQGSNTCINACCYKPNYVAVVHPLCRSLVMV